MRVFETLKRLYDSDGFWTLALIVVGLTIVIGAAIGHATWLTVLVALVIGMNIDANYRSWRLGKRL